MNPSSGLILKGRPSDYQYYDTPQENLGNHQCNSFREAKEYAINLSGDGDFTSGHDSGFFLQDLARGNRKRFAAQLVSNL